MASAEMSCDDFFSVLQGLKVKFVYNGKTGVQKMFPPILRII